jgi:adenylate cyclase
VAVVDHEPESEQWRRILTEGHRPMRMARHTFRHVPSAPRCKVCANPFGGLGGRVFALAGYTPSRKNPNLCARCCDSLPPGGAEVDVAVLFADVRGSTDLGERTGPTPYAELLNRFYAVATAVLLRHDAVIDKLIGDEAMALFIPGVAGPEYRRRAVEAAVEVVRETSPWLRVGAAVNAGTAYVGNVGTAVVDFTALGDPVNVAARLQEHAGAGEVVVADELAGAYPGAEGRMLALRGHAAPVATRVIRV